jgi:glycosyltransferase involved in cell wall biosynthesis
MKIEFSLVIPTHNRSKQLLLTLISLKNQYFPMDKFEVIVIDDCSFDNTQEIVNNFQSPYRLIYRKVEERRGPAYARNLGTSVANGEYIIFCDADFVLLPHFLETIKNYHTKFNNSVISGTPGCYKSVYTHYYPNFSDFDKGNLRIILKNSGIEYKSIFQSDNIIDLITPEDLEHNFNSIYKTVGWDLISPELKKEYLSTDVAPWALFITRCVSLKKDSFEAVGGFDDSLIRGAGEDWELGYRLYKRGLGFIGIEDSIGFHQEHPSAFRIPFKEYSPFSKVLLDKFGKEDTELVLLSLWQSSDDLWKEIHIYKDLLRKMNNFSQLPDEQKQLINLLLRSCRMNVENHNK